MSIRERIFAAVYDPLSARTEERVGAKLKRKLLADVSGRVVEIGVVTGLSFARYPAAVALVAVDPSGRCSGGCCAEARDRTGRDVTFLAAPAEALPNLDDSFDAAVSLAVLCTVEDPARLLAEIRPNRSTPPSAPRTRATRSRQAAPERPGTSLSQKNSSATGQGLMMKR